jgi:hypothetical protein
VRLARRADILVRSSVVRRAEQQIRALFVFGVGCGQECPRGLLGVIVAALAVDFPLVQIAEFLGETQPCVTGKVAAK